MASMKQIYNAKATQRANVIQAINNPRMFGSLFPDLSSQFPWMVLLKAMDALPMGETELALYRRCTGREYPPTVAPSEIYIIAGRRSGKSFISSLKAVYLACFKQLQEKPECRQAGGDSGPSERS